jgi:hypothetical protein
MNILIIILGIIVVFMTYYIYTILTAVPVIIKRLDLTKSASIIPPNTINDPYSINYTIGVWVYISQFSPKIERFLMFGDKTYYGDNSLFSLRMEPNGSNLYADILVNKVSSTSTTMTPSILPVLLNSKNEGFPIQKWVYVSVSVSNNFIEAYINGKFITAVNIHNNTNFGINGVFQAQAPQDLNSGATFTFGGKGSSMDNGTIRDNGSPIVLAKLSRWSVPMSAGDVYNHYIKGNGQESNIWGPNYNLNVVLSKDTNSYTLPIF